LNQARTTSDKQPLEPAGLTDGEGFSLIAACPAPRNIEPAGNTRSWFRRR